MTIEPRLNIQTALVDAYDTSTNIDTLRETLAERASAEGLLDVAYQIVDSPYGSLLVAATDNGVVRIAFEREDHDTVLFELAENVGGRILRTKQRTAVAVQELGEYFEGTRHMFDVAVDLRLTAGFRRQVLEQLRRIPYGDTESYREIAIAVGSPQAFRAVGSACGHNPVPILVPCHRVVRHDGNIGEYRGGQDMKVGLLTMEGGLHH